MRLHAHGVDHRVCAATAGAVPDRLGHVVDLVPVQGLDSVPARHLDPVPYEVHPDYLVHALMPRDPAGHLPDRAEPENGERPALRRVGVSHRLPCRGQDIREEHEALVRRRLGHLDRAKVGLRHAQVLGLPARHLAVELRVAEQGGALLPVPHLGGLALGVELVVAHPAASAGDVERHDHAVSGRDVADFAAHLLHDAHRLMAEDVPLVDERAEYLIEVKVGPADARGGDPYDRVGRLFDFRVRDGVDADVTLAMPGHCLHAARRTRSGQACKPTSLSLAPKSAARGRRPSSRLSERPG